MANIIENKKINKRKNRFILNRFLKVMIAFLYGQASTLYDFYYGRTTMVQNGGLEIANMHVICD